MIVCAMLVGGCTRAPGPAKTELQPKSLSEVQGYLADKKTELDLFRLRGPFEVTTRTDQEVRLAGTQRISADVYLSAPAAQAPLLIFLHGYDSSKEAHANQAMHVASWGMHAMSVQLPNKGSWITNGRTLARLAGLIRRAPGIIDSRVDVNRIILVGHSFGASAVAVALAEGAPAAGAILLDPAAIGRDLPKLLQQINRPLMVLGADDRIATTRNREFFYRYVRGGIAELSIREATHEDAQYPSEYAVRNGGFDPDTTEAAQIAFVSALTSAALSLSATGTFDYAWTSFRPVFENGTFFNARKK